MRIKCSTDGAHAILEAAADGNLDFLAQVSDADLHQARCLSGCTALHWAAGCNQVDTVRALIQHRLLDVDVAASRKARGRTPLHYACRNGCRVVVKLLIETFGADPNVKAKHGVTPFQLAVWRNNADICRYLVSSHDVDPSQVNNFDCGAMHWLGIAPIDRAGSDEDGMALIPLASWLVSQIDLKLYARQRQGHSALHKAAWGGHLALCRYLHEVHAFWDDTPDLAGNYAADLADMAQTLRHAKVATYLRESCSRESSESCAVLGIPEGEASNEALIRRVYLTAVKDHHPDKGGDESRFHAIQNAYRHLSINQGRGTQSNPAHSLHLMLQAHQESCKPVESKQAESDANGYFKARLIAVLLEYGDRGLDLSNLKKKWNQVWPDVSLESYRQGLSKRDGRSMSRWILRQAGDVVELRSDGMGCVRVFPKQCSQSSVQQVAARLQLCRVKES